MTVNVEQIKHGLANFIDQEIASNMSGWERIGFSAASVLVINNLQNIIERYKHNKFIEMLNVIDENNNVEIDILKDAVQYVFPKEGEYINIPIIKERLKVTPEDIDKLYNYIKEA